MSQSTQLALIWIIVPLIAFIVWRVKSLQLKLKESGKWESYHRRKMHNRFVKFSTNFLTRKQFTKISANYAAYDCFTVADVEEKSVTVFTKALRMSVIFPIVAVVLLQDVTFGLMAVLMSIVYFDNTICKSVDKMYMEMTIDLANGISSARDKYLETGVISTAVLYAEKGKYLNRAFQQIFEMLTATDGKSLLLDFLDNAPIKRLRTFAIQCYIKNEYGDSKDGSQGSSFSDDLVTLRQEIDAEVRKLKKTKMGFKVFQILVLAALAVPPIAEAFLLSMIPGTSLLLKGMYGSLVNSLMIIAVGIIYYVIGKLTRPSVVNQVDTSTLIIKLSRRLRVRKFIHTLLPTKIKDRNKYRALLSDSITSKSLDYVFTSKVVYGAVGTVIAFIFMILFSVANKAYLGSNYNSLKFSSRGEITETQLKQIKTVDDMYMSAAEKMPDEEAYALVKARLSGFSDIEIQNEVIRLSTKWDNYKSMGFKWYFVLVGALGGVVGWMVPNISLKLRRYMVKFEAEEDVMQLQTLMIVLSGTNMSVFEALYWMEKQSGIHKAPLRYAYHEYVSDPEGALYRLKASVSSVELKRLVSKLESAIYKLSLHEAFSDMRLSKENTLRLIEMVQEKNLESKISAARSMSNVPLYIALFGCFALPIIILAFSELGESFGSVTNI